MDELMRSAFAHAMRVHDQARALVGGDPRDATAWLAGLEVLVAEHGIEPSYTDLASLLIAEGSLELPARVAAYWAARRFYAADPRVLAELAGPSDEALAAERLSIELDRLDEENAQRYGRRPSATAAAVGAEPTERVAQRQVDWSAERIRDEYRRFWTSAERRFWDGEYKAAQALSADDLEAARVATRRVLDRRIERGGRCPAPVGGARA